MASANEFSPFSSSFLFNLLLIYIFNICIRQPLWLVTLGTSLKTKLPCVASRGGLEDRSWVTGEFLSPKGVLLHTLNNSSNCFSSMFLLAERIAIILNALLDSSYTVAPHSPYTLGTVPLCCVYMCATCTHTLAVGAAHQQVCSRRVERCPGFSVVTQLPSLCFPPIVLCGIFIAC